MTVDSDEQLIERFRTDGDEGAFNELVERHQRDVYRLAFRLAHNQEDAHDLGQEAWVRVYRSLGRFRGESSFRTWLCRIVMNVGLNHLRKTRHDREQRTRIEEVSLPVAPTGLSDVLDAEARVRLEGAIDRLPEKQRRTLVLKVFQELKYTEIAEVMGCSVGTAKANFFHAVRSLKRQLDLARSTSARAAAGEPAR